MLILNFLMVIIFVGLCFVAGTVIGVMLVGVIAKSEKEKYGDGKNVLYVFAERRIKEWRAKYGSKEAPIPEIANPYNKEG